MLDYVEVVTYEDAHVIKKMMMKNKIILSAQKSEYENLNQLFPTLN